MLANHLQPNPTQKLNQFIIKGKDSEDLNRNYDAHPEAKDNSQQLDAWSFKADEDANQIAESADDDLDEKLAFRKPLGRLRPHGLCQGLGAQGGDLASRP